MDADNAATGALTGSLGAKPPSPEASKGAAEPQVRSDRAAQGSVPSDGEYAGKSREELMGMYQSLAQKMGQMSEELNQHRTFTKSVAPYFISDGENVSFNDEYIRQYGEAKGLWKKSQQQPPRSNPQSAIPQTPGGSDDPYGDAEIDEEYKPLLNMINKRLDSFEKKYDSSIVPLQQEFFRHRSDIWVDAMRQKYRDFDEWRPKIIEYMNSRRIGAGSLKDLEEHYIATKAIHGGMVDKKTSELERLELEKTLHQILPGAGSGGRVAKDPSEMTDDEMFGPLPDFSDQKQKAFMNLTGKNKYRP